MSSQPQGSAAARDRSPVIAVTSLPGAPGRLAVAAALGIAAARSGDATEGVVVCEMSDRPRRPTLVSSAAARRLESRVRGELRAAARGAVCWVALAADAWREQLDLCGAAGASLVVASLEPASWRQLIADPSAGVRGAAVRADLPADRSLAALTAIELRRAGMPIRIVTGAPGVVGTRRALAGIDPGGQLGAKSERLARGLIGAPPGQAAPRRPEVTVGPRPHPRPGEAGQALPLVLGLALAIVVGGLALALLGAAASGAGRLQRAADLAAVSAARSMRDDHNRLFVPRRTEAGRRNPAYLSDAAYRQRAGRAAEEALRANGIPEAEMRARFSPDGPAPTRVRIAIRGEIALDGDDTGREVSADAVAEAYPLASSGEEATRMATGGGYSGPLAERQGKSMRPDVAAAFDRLAAAARQAGHALTITSAFRSDAEQAALFAANPDPRWVAPPGTSLHRCATELDLGPPSAYGWLSSNARRFGFLRRYAWEAWHFGYVEGPPPCSAAGNRVGAASRRGDGAASGGTSLPSFVPTRFRNAIARAATRWNVPPGLLAAQLMAESGFNPLAISPAGARGIAQFMPATAAAYGLRDPFDAAAAIDAQAHLMSDLLRQFGDTALALAAYNAGPAPVIACRCVPPYAETRAYVARILGLLAGAGEIAPPALEVRLVG